MKKNIKKITNNLFKIPCLKPICHSYLIIDEKKNVLVDPGARENLPHLKNILSEVNLSITDIDQIILTHCHYDHSGAIEFFNHAELLCHEFCYAALTLQDDNSIHALKNGVSLPAITTDRFRLLDDHDIIEISNEKWEVIYTPGHSIDSICLFNHNQHILISGDTVFATGIPALITNSGSDSSLFQSINKLSQYSIKEVLPGHGIIDHEGNNTLLKTKENIIKRIIKNNKKTENGGITCKYQNL